MNEKRIRTARLIRLGLFIAVWFSVLYMFRWEIGTPVTYDQGFGDGKESIGYVKLHRWTGTSCHWIALSAINRITKLGYLP